MHREHHAAKVTAEHLRRDAYLYVRQSTLYQVANNTESAAPPIRPARPGDRAGLAGRAGRGHRHRPGPVRRQRDRPGRFPAPGRRRVPRQGRDRARPGSLPAGPQQRRLAPTAEICALSATLICDEDGLYDPGTINDRLLLGLKGTMSEAELHYLRARLQGGILAKAARGELAVRLPVGLVYDAADQVALDPDAGVRRALAHLFATFEATGSASAVVKAFARDGLTFPGRHLTGAQAGELYWKPLRHDHVLFVLHNPRYAGAFCYGRRRHVSDADGHQRTFVNRPPNGPP